MKKTNMKRTLCAVLTFCLLLGLLPLAAMPALAAPQIGYDPARPDDWVGKRVCRFDYTYDKAADIRNHQPYLADYIGNGAEVTVDGVTYTGQCALGPQCVGYVYCRLQEKLNIRAGFNSGDGAKNMPANARRVNGTELTSYATGNRFTLRFYENDGGANIKKDSFVCFDGYASADPLTSFGHVVYVEEVVRSGDVSWIYYTEGSDGYRRMEKDGILQKRTLEDFLSNAYRGGRYLATISYESAHAHSYDADGVCAACGAYELSADSASSRSKRAIPPAYYAAVKSDAPVRSGPHADCTALRTLSAGEEILVDAYLTNSAGNRWYVLRDGGYIYSGNVKRLRSAVTLDGLKMTVKNDGDVELSTTVRKLKGMKASDFGVRLVELGAWDNAHTRGELGELGIATFGATVQKSLPDPNGEKYAGQTQYGLTAKLRSEMGLTLIPGEEYAAQLTVTVNDVLYESNLVTFTAGAPSGTFVSIDVGGGQTAPNSYGDETGGALWLRVDRTQLRVSEYVSCTFGPAGAVNFVVAADRVGGGNYLRHNVGGGTVHEFRIEEPGNYDVYVQTSDGGVTKTSNTVRVTVTGTAAPSDDRPRVEMAPSLVYAGETDARFEVLVWYWNLQEPSAFGVQVTDAEGHQLFSCYSPVTPDDPGFVYPAGSLYELRSVPEDMGYALDPDTPYRFRIWADFPGVRGTYYSEYLDFRTAKADAPAEPERKGTPVPVRFDANWSGGGVTELYAVKERYWGYFTNAEGTRLYFSNFPDVEREGYVFAGWFDAPEGGSRVYPGDPFSGRPTTLYAHWQTKPKDPPVRVCFDCNDGSGRVIWRWVKSTGWYRDFVDADGSPTGETMPAPTRQGYKLLSWNTKPDGNGFPITPDTLVARKEPITVYAVWIKAKPQPSPFADVAEDSWYCDWVRRAYASGLINGKSATTFAPDSELTMAEALKLAACIHQKLNDGAVTLGNSPSGHWCDSYYAYLRERGLLSASKIDYKDYGKAVTRAEMVRIFFDVMNAGQRRQINEIPGGSIPDVDLLDSDQTWFAWYVYAFYQAGILNGSDDYGTFHPHDTIRRSAVAAIIVRVIEPDLRVGPPAKLGT